MAETNLFLDIETIPQGTLEDFIPEKTPPKNLKDPEKIEKWYEENVKDEFLKQALDPNRAQILCIGAAFDDNPVDVFYSEEEMVGEILDSFYDFIIANTQEELEDEKILEYDIKWIGHNIRKFDLEVIWVSAIRLKRFELARMISRHPYSNNVLDTMELWAGPNRMNFTSLDKILNVLGLGGKTEGMDGSKVYEEYLNGNLHSKILPYQEDDVEKVRNIFNYIKKGLS